MKTLPLEPKYLAVSRRLLNAARDGVQPRPGWQHLLVLHPRASLLGQVLRTRKKPDCTSPSSLCLSATLLCASGVRLWPRRLLLCVLAVLF